MANNKSNTVDDILYMLLAEFENRSEEYKAIAYAIKTEEAIQFAKAVLPEKHLAEDCLSEYCGLHHSAGESVPQIDFEKMRLTIDVRNQTIDEVEPIVAKLIMERDDYKKMYYRQYKKSEELSTKNNDAWKKIKELENRHTEAEVSVADIAAASAVAWCTKENENKEMDVVLAYAIANAVHKKYRSYEREAEEK